MWTMQAAPAKAISPLEGRITSLDLIRGLVMVLMAIDHVRVYSGLPAGGPTAGIFLCIPSGTHCSVHLSTCAVPVEFAATLPGVRDRGRSVVCSVLLVCGPQGAAAISARNCDGDLVRPTSETTGGGIWHVVYS